MEFKYGQRNGKKWWLAMDNIFSDLCFTIILNKALIFTKQLRKLIQSPNISLLLFALFEQFIAT